MKKGVTTNDPLADDDEKGIATVYTPDGTQQMTVQHVRDEWRGVGSIPTPGVDGMGLNGMSRPSRPGAIWRRNLAQRVRAKRQPPCSDGRSEGAHVNLAIHVHIDGEEMNDHPPAELRAAIRVQSCTLQPALTFEPGHPPRILGAATTSILRALTSSIFGALTARVFGALTLPVNRTLMKSSHGGRDRERINTFPIFQRSKMHRLAPA